MAKCPKCNRQLSIKDWRQKCPGCGANLVLYDLQERLMQDADIAEVQHYHFQKKIDRLKASFVGSKFAIARIFTSLLPIAALFLPIVKAKLSAPFPDFDGGISAITLYKGISNGALDSVGDLFASPDTKAAAIVLTCSIGALLLSLIFILLHLVLLMLACSPKGKLRNYTLDIILLVLGAASPTLFIAIPQNSFISGSLSFGAFLYFLLLVVNLVLDILTFKNAKEIKHKQCYVGGIPIEEYFELVEKGTSQKELRAEMYRRLNEMQVAKDAEIAAQELAAEKEATK